MAGPRPFFVNIFCVINVNYFYIIPFLSMIQINFINFLKPAAHKSTEFVLFADDTNIFFKAKNKTLAYEKANTILKFVNLYMMTNKLHINMSKSCFIDFKNQV